MMMMLMMMIVLMRYIDKLESSRLQFGFKAKHSTAMCTMIVKEVISYYVNNGSQVACTFLDATKAFDRLEYCKLFSLFGTAVTASCSMHTAKYVH